MASFGRSPRAAGHGQPSQRSRSGSQGRAGSQGRSGSQGARRPPQQSPHSLFGQLPPRRPSQQLSPRSVSSSSHPPKPPSGRRPSQDNVRPMSGGYVADGDGLSQDCRAHRDEISRLNKVIKEAERDLKQLSAYTDKNGSPRRRSAPDINSEALKVLQRKHARDMTQRRRSNSVSGRSTPAATPGPRTPGTTQSARFNEEDMQSECLEGEDETGFAGLYTWTVVIDRTSGEPLGVDLAARGQHVLEVESIR